MDEEQLNGLWGTFSGRRMAKYLAASGEDRARALNLYLWNVRIGAEFHFCIQTCEVALRNRVEAAIRNAFTEAWFTQAEFLAVADEKRRADLEQARNRITNRGHDLTRDSVTATLSFGFWVEMLAPRYNPPIWGAQLRQAFPNLPPGRSRTSVHQSATSALILRNRIFHHEPLITMDLSKVHTDICNLLDWLCPHTSLWVRGEDRVQTLLRAKP